MKLLILIANSEAVWIAELLNMLHVFNKTFQFTYFQYHTPDYD